MRFERPWAWPGTIVLAVLAVALSVQGAPRTFDVHHRDGKSPATVELGLDGKPGRRPSEPRHVSAREISRSVLRSDAKATLLAVYAAYCGPCRRQMPLAAELADTHRKAGLRVVAFSVHPNPRAFEEYARRFGGALELMRIERRRRGDVKGELRRLGMRTGNALTIPRFGLFDQKHRLVAQSPRVARLRGPLAELL